jgi:hypothetical protein
VIIDQLIAGIYAKRAAGIMANRRPTDSSRCFAKVLAFGELRATLLWPSRVLLCSEFVASNCS